MSRKKYVKDYKLDRYVDEKGRIRTSAHYAGEAFRFGLDGEELKKQRTLFTAVCAVMWIAFIVPLFPATAAMKLPYFSLPFIFSALPLWLVSEATYAMYTAKQPFSRRIAEKFSKRLAVYAVMLLVLTLGAAAGFAAGLIFARDNFTAIDTVPAVSALILLAGSVTLFARRASVPVVSCGPASEPEPREGAL